MMYKEKSSRLLPLGAAALLIGGGVAAYYAVMTRRPVADVPVGANIVPQDAMMAVSFSTQAQQWQKLREYGTPESKAALEQSVKQWRDRIFTNNGYTYETDIAPWVGEEMMVALLPHQTITSDIPPKPDAPLSSPSQPAVVMVFPIANPLKAQEILAEPKPVSQGQVVERTYRGIEVIETQGLPTQNYSAAVLGQQFLLVTTDPNATDRAIDTYRGDASLAKTPGYASASQKIQTPRAFAQVYLNIPVAVSVAFVSYATQIPPESLEKLQQNQGFASSVILESNGIGLKGISWLKPSSQKTITVENKSQEMLRRIPDNAMMVVSGGNLQRLWQDYNQGANSNPIAPFNPEALRNSFQQSTQLDLDKDLLSWMNGEFALSLIPAVPNKQVPQKFSAGFVLMVQTRDRKAAETTFTQLDGVMKQKNYEIESAEIQGQPVTKWISPYGGFSIIRGWLNNNVAFVTLGAPIADQILPETPSSIAGNTLFKQTIPSELNPNNGSFFIDVDRVFDRNNLSLPQLPPQQEVWVNAIQSVGVTAAVVNERSTRYDTFIKIKDSTQPASPPATPTPENPDLLPSESNPPEN